MPSSPSPSLRIELQGTGENLNLWGVLLNSALSRVDDAAAGWANVVVPAAGYSLTSANYTTDEARKAMIRTTGAGGPLTIPSVSKRYDVWNACTGDLTVTNGSASVTVKPSEIVSVITDGGARVARVQSTDVGGSRITSVGTPTANSDAATKQYADNLAFTANAGILPGQTGNADTYLSTDGTTAGWRAFSASASAVRTGTSTTVALTPGDTYDALAEVPLTDAATVAVDMSTFTNAVLNPIGGNRTLGNPTNPKVGQEGAIRIVQDGTGSRTLAFAGNWKRQGGAPALTTTAGATDVLLYKVITATFILYDLKANPS